MPPASVPMDSILCARRNCDSIRFFSVTSVLMTRIDLGCPSSSRTNVQRLSTILMHLTVPLAFRDDGLTSRMELRRVLFKENVFRVLADHFFSRPAIDFFGALVPEQNILIEITYQNGVLRLGQQRGLLAHL